MATKKIQILEGKILQSGSMTHATLSASNWAGSGPYTQAIVLNDVTINSKIDIQADAATIALINGSYSLCVENDNCAVTAYAIGNKPTTDLNIQLIITAVKKPTPDDIVWGNVLR